MDKEPRKTKTRRNPSPDITHIQKKTNNDDDGLIVKVQDGVVSDAVVECPIIVVKRGRGRPRRQGSVSSITTTESEPSILSSLTSTPESQISANFNNNNNNHHFNDSCSTTSDESTFISNNSFDRLQSPSPSPTKKQPNAAAGKQQQQQVLQSPMIMMNEDQKIKSAIVLLQDCILSSKPTTTKPTPKSKGQTKGQTKSQQQKQNPSVKLGPVGRRKKRGRGRGWTKKVAKNQNPAAPVHLEDTQMKQEPAEDQTDTTTTMNHIDNEEFNLFNKKKNKTPLSPDINPSSPVKKHTLQLQLNPKIKMANDHVQQQVTLKYENDKNISKMSTKGQNDDDNIEPVVPVVVVQQVKNEIINEKSFSLISSSCKPLAGCPGSIGPLKAQEFNDISTYLMDIPPPKSFTTKAARKFFPESSSTSTSMTITTHSTSSNTIPGLDIPPDEHEHEHELNELLPSTNIPISFLSVEKAVKNLLDDDEHEDQQNHNIITTPPSKSIPYYISELDSTFNSPSNDSNDIYQPKSISRCSSNTSIVERAININSLVNLLPNHHHILDDKDLQSLSSSKKNKKKKTDGLVSSTKKGKKELKKGNKKKGRKPKIKSKEKEEEKEKVQENEEETEESTQIRRSSRIKKEVVKRRGFEQFNINDTITNLSLPNLISMSNFSSANNSIHTSASNSPPLADSLVITTIPATTTTATATTTTPLKPQKLKSRWRDSVDAEKSLNKENVQNDQNQNQSNQISSLVSIIKTSEEIIKERNLVKKPGYIVCDPNDAEVHSKLKHFDGIEENIYRKGRRYSKEDNWMECDCFLTKEEFFNGDVGCKENCLNRMVMVECGKNCTLGNRCANKMFQKKRYCPLEVFKTDKKGHGLRTLQKLPKGGFVIEYVGEVLDSKEFNQRIDIYAKGNQEHFYFMSLKVDSIIDATLKGNCSRFINHSCEPNCETQKWTADGELRIGFFAIRDLEVGEEITFDYKFERYGKSAQQCFCETPSCRGWIGGDDAEEDYPDDEIDIDADDEVSEASTTERIIKPKVKVVRKKKKEVKLEDKSLKEDLLRLEESGMKNRNHTVTLVRLMIRAEDWEIRERILNVLKNGADPCLRLFIDYHGLKHLYNWMKFLPLPNSNTEEPQIILDDSYHKTFLQVLENLPIQNLTLLKDSKILQLVDDWSKSPSTTRTIVKHEQTVKQGQDQEPQVSSTTTITDTSCEIEKKLEFDQDKLDKGNEIEHIEIDGNQIVKEIEPMEIQIDTETEKTEKTELVEPLLDDVIRPYVHEIKLEIPTSEVEIENMVIDQEQNIHHQIIEINENQVESIKEEENLEIIDEMTWAFVNFSKTMLDSWSDLKEVFRIPKKERVEQMKEHEREADRQSSSKQQRTSSSSSYSKEKDDSLWSSSKRKQSSSSYSAYDRTSKGLPSRYSKYNEDRDRRIQVVGHYTNFSPTSSYHSNSSSSYKPYGIYGRSFKDGSNLSTEEKRRIFEKNVQKSEQDIANKKMQEELQLLHECRCTIAKMDSKTVPLVDPSGEFYLDSTTITWKPIVPDDPSCPPEPIMLITALFYPVTIPSIIPVPQTPPLQPQQQQLVEVVVEENPLSFLNFDWQQHPDLKPPPPIPPLVLKPGWKMAKTESNQVYYYDVKTRESSWEPPCSSEEEDNDDDDDEDSDDEEESEESAGEDTEEINKAENNVPVPVGGDSGIDIDMKETQVNLNSDLTMLIDVQNESTSSPAGETTPVSSKLKIKVRAKTRLEERRERRMNSGLVIENIISPRTEEEKKLLFISSKAIKARKMEDYERKVKLKYLAREGKTLNDEDEEILLKVVTTTTTTTTESVDPNNLNTNNISLSPTSLLKAGNPEDIEKIIVKGQLTQQSHHRKKQHRNRSNNCKVKRPLSLAFTDQQQQHQKSSQQHQQQQQQQQPMSKAEDLFRREVANVIVAALNPYRKDDCKSGRIISSDDFKHLARKLTHTVATKELKHRRDGNKLEVTDSVKNKTREYVKKYMASYKGKNYTPSPVSTEEKRHSSVNISCSGSSSSGVFEGETETTTTVSSSASKRIKLVENHHRERKISLKNDKKKNLHQIQPGSGSKSSRELSTTTTTTTTSATTTSGVNTRPCDKDLIDKMTFSPQVHQVVVPSSSSSSIISELFNSQPPPPFSFDLNDTEEEEEEELVTQIEARGPATGHSGHSRPLD